MALEIFRSCRKVDAIFVNVDRVLFLDVATVSNPLMTEARSRRSECERSVVYDNPNAYDQLNKKYDKRSPSGIQYFSF